MKVSQRIREKAASEGAFLVMSPRVGLLLLFANESSGDPGPFLVHSRVIPHSVDKSGIGL